MAQGQVKATRGLEDYVGSIFDVGEDLLPLKFSFQVQICLGVIIALWLLYNDNNNFKSLA